LNIKKIIQKGYWRLLDYDFYFEIVDNMLKLIDERSWQPDQIPVNEVFEELVLMFDLSILNQFVNYYFEQKSKKFPLEIHEISY
jgi:hypothetical protein